MKSLLTVLARFCLGIISLLTLAVISYVVFWLWMFTGCYYGSEISPDDFSIRDFVYYQPFPTQEGFWRSRTMDRDFSAALASQNMISTRPATVWHLVQDNATPLRSRDVQAEILTKYLLSRDDDGDLFWIAWNSKYGLQAKRLWPLIQHLSFDQLYPLTPVVFEEALLHQSASPAEFQQALQGVVIAELNLMLEEAKDANNTARQQLIEGYLEKYSSDWQTLTLAPQQP